MEISSYPDIEIEEPEFWYVEKMARGTHEVSFLEVK